MVMQTVEMKIYTFKELSQEAREKAFYEFWCQVEYPLQVEVRNCLESFTDMFGFSVYHWEYDSIMASHRESFPDHYHEIKGESAREWFGRHKETIYDDACPLTGVCFDEFILTPIRSFMDDKTRTDSVAEVLTECVGDFFRAVVHDVENYYSMESFEDMCAAAEYMFFENGSLY